MKIDPQNTFLGALYEKAQNTSITTCSYFFHMAWNCRACKQHLTIK